METKTYLHRVAVVVSTQILMDIEAENDVDKIRAEALRAYFAGEGDPEEGFTYPTDVVVYPWLEEGQTPPTGSLYPEPTFMEVSPDEISHAVHNTEEE